MESARRQTILERIESRCLIQDTGFFINGQPSPCHLWQGPTSGEGRGGGYGRMSLDGQTVAVHLVIFTHYYGFIPGKKQVDHLCCRRLCCNPAHLELVSHLKNQRRRAARTKEKTPCPALSSASSRRSRIVPSPITPTAISVAGSGPSPPG